MHASRERPRVFRCVFIAFAAAHTLKATRYDEYEVPIMKSFLPRRVLLLLPSRGHRGELEGHRQPALPRRSASI